MKLCTAAVMRALDACAINTLGIPSTLLMENAAGHVARAALELCPLGGRAAVFCGTGNNGGDGVAAAVYLIKHGVETRVFILGDMRRTTEDTAEMLRRLSDLGVGAEDFSSADDIEDCLSGCSVIIDAMFGIGLRSGLEGIYERAAEIINASGVPVIAADVPSGVMADTGIVPGTAVRADVTVTFSLAKPGLFVEPGCVCCGEVRVVDIGIPAELLDEADAEAFAVTSDDVSIPRRPMDSHKGDFGRDLIVAGSVGYTGAPVLAAGAASRTGAGLTYLGVPKKTYGIAAAKCEEVMPFPLKCDRRGRLKRRAAKEIKARLTRCDVCLVGPGLGRSKGLDKLVRDILTSSGVPVVLDADGINAVSGNIDVLDEAHAGLILTPHPGEFKRLGGDVSAGRIAAARDFAVKHGCVLVLKGCRTVTAAPDGRIFVNTTGSPSLSKGGSGDVLAGMIASLVGQGYDLADAAVKAVYLHGLAGEICADETGEYSTAAGDVILAVSKAIKRVTR